MLVHFDGDAGIYNISDLKTWAGTWYEIGRGIAMAVGDKPEDCRVVGASHGSIIVALATTYGIAKVVSEILLKAIKVRERVVDLQIQQEQLRALQLGNRKAEEALQEEIDTAVESGQTRALEEIAESRSLDGEHKNALKVSIENSFTFINKGGLIDVHVHSEDEPEGDNAEDGTEGADEASTRTEILQMTREIRSIEARIKAIEHKPDD